VSLGDDIRSESLADSARLRRERDAAINELATLRSQVESMQRALGFIDSVESAVVVPPKWTAPARKRKSSATLMLLLSDTHFDEVVSAAEVDGLNCYNRQIATARLERWCHNVVKMAQHHLTGLQYDGCILMLGGDIFSGDIHEELSETNADTILGSLLYWSEQLAAAIGALASTFGRVHVVSVVGNHGRTSRKPRAKLRARTNYDWLLAKILERQFTTDKSVTFAIPESADCYLTVYGYGHLLTHGDQVSGGGGIGGIYPPIMRMRARKQGRYLATGKSLDTLWLGHWHQYLSTPSMVVNGSMKGYDEYALISGFGFELPQQAMAVVTPEHNLTIQMPVFCADREREGW
jgi:hypothetical protein